MSALNLSRRRNVKGQVVKTANPYTQEDNDDDLLSSFSLPRYFQIHFQHIHERTDNVHEELAELKLYVNKLETKLDALLLLLNQHQRER
ncbi:MAG: hypothetical protein Q8Q54_12570 [Methylococcales bacterium]|nr:hypothetical protein [Methylococcales bacterium]MDP3839742.1 hypothetical protein [Methylococcales bacterium]